MEILAWILLVTLALLGVVGTVVPVIPGLGLLFVGALIHKWILPQYLNWWVIGVVGVAALVSYALDFAGTVAGAKWGGATKYGLIGAALGGIVGIAFGLPGIFAGPLIGAFAGELLAARRPIEQAVHAGIGAGLGVAVSTVLRFCLTLAMILLVFIDLVVN